MAGLELSALKHLFGNYISLLFYGNIHYSGLYVILPNGDCGSLDEGDGVSL